MKEHETCNRNAEVVFDGLLRSAHNPIECAFGRLKACWSILTHSIDLKLESIPHVVYSCFVLHNYCEQNKSYVDDCTVRNQIQLSMDNEQTYKNVADPIYSCNAGKGEFI